jgi:ATP-dependent RNA helicase RhlE
MYQRSNRNSSRGYGSNRGGGGYSRRPYGGGNRFRKQGESQLGRNLGLFVKKAGNFMPIEEFVPKHTFDQFEICDALKQNIKSHGYTVPTPIQDQGIEPILNNRDFIGLANTGTGKTAAFLIPVINKIYKDRNKRALIVTPTRELAAQIHEEMQKFTTGMRIYSTVVIGGSNMRRQVQDIRSGVNVVIATPGRLKDLIQRRIIYLEDYSTFILDEVDLMVDIGFINDVKYFVSLLPKVRQSLFFSATIAPKIHGILQSFVTDPVTVSVKQQDTAENIDQDVIKVFDQSKKVDQLHDLLVKDGFDKVLIFNRTKHGVEKLHKDLVVRGFKVGSIHGNKKQGQRQRTLQSFKNNEIKILLATDVASRGLDIDNVTHVINYDLPQTYDDYVHRIGRTGRANKKGIALTFV